MTIYNSVDDISLKLTATICAIIAKATEPASDETKNLGATTCSNKFGPEIDKKNDTPKILLYIS
jgi:hypothetical protein